MLNIIGFLRPLMSDSEYTIFVGINILKTLQRLAATTKKFFYKINVPKILQNFDR